MITRSRSHVIEEESRRAFDRAIPAEWVVRPQNPDYGLDNQVQIFKENCATPFFFFVQLKASDTIPDSLDTPSETFSCKHLLHYLEYSCPIMLVLYDAKGKRLFFDWTHVVYNSLSLDEKRKWYLQKTVTVKFSRRFDTTDSHVIEQEVCQQYYHLGYQPETATNFSIFLYSEDELIDAAQLRNNLIIWFAGYPKGDFIRIEEAAAKDAEICICSNPPAFRITCGKDSTAFPLFKGPDGSIQEEHLCTDLKLLIALILSMGGRINTAIDLIGRIIWDKSPLSPLSIFLLSKPSIASLYSRANRGAEAMVNAEQLLIAGFPMPALVLATSIIQQSPLPQFSQQYRRFLMRMIESPAPGIKMASLHYNLAASLRHDSYHREAVHHYHLAAKEDPSYLQRPYWWAELGGSLFLLKKLTWSERCYRKALELGETRLPARALLGDVLLHEGKFHEACSELARYLDEETYPVPEPILKHWLASYLAEKFGDISRNQGLATVLVDQAISLDNIEEIQNILIEALKADPLSGLAWYNYAVSKSKHDRSDHYWEWLITAIIQNWDVVAWANALLLMTTAKTPPPINLLSVALFEGFRLHSTILENEIMRILESQLPLEQAREMVRRMGDMAKSLSAAFGHEPSFEYRFYDDKASIPDTKLRRGN